MLFFKPNDLTKLVLDSVTDLVEIKGLRHNVVKKDFQYYGSIWQKHKT